MMRRVHKTTVSATGNQRPELQHPALLGRTAYD